MVRQAQGGTTTVRRDIAPARRAPRRSHAGQPLISRHSGQTSYFCTAPCGKKGSPYVIAELPSSRVQVTVDPPTGHVGAATAQAGAQAIPANIGSVIKTLAQSLLKPVIAGGGGVGTMVQWVVLHPPIPWRLLAIGLSLLLLGLLFLVRPVRKGWGTPVTGELEPAVEPVATNG